MNIMEKMTSISRRGVSWSELELCISTWSLHLLPRQWDMMSDVLCIRDAVWCSAQADKQLPSLLFTYSLSSVSQKTRKIFYALELGSSWVKSGINQEGGCYWKMINEPPQTWLFSSNSSSRIVCFIRSSLSTFFFKQNLCTFWSVCTSCIEYCWMSMKQVQSDYHGILKMHLKSWCVSSDGYKALMLETPSKKIPSPCQQLHPFLKIP